MSSSHLLRSLFIATGGALGALGRYWLSTTVHNLFGREFPYGTLTVNVVGCALMGVLYVLFYERMVISTELRAGLLIGLLGALTTFSTFSIETLGLIENGEPIKAGLNTLLSVALCLCVCWAGIVLARQL